jgi:hypothetical protein
MGIDPAFDLLAFADRLGEPADEAMTAGVGVGHGPPPDGPMTPEQADHLSHLLRRSGRPAPEATMTFAEAKARITELSHELG